MVDFFSQMLTAMALKLSTSMDDILWLSPFLVLCASNHQKAGFSFIYAGLSVVVVTVALLLARASESGLKSALNTGDGTTYVYWTPRRILSFLAGLALVANSLKEWLEWRSDVENVAACNRLTSKLCWSRAEIEPQHGEKSTSHADTEETGEKNQKSINACTSHEDAPVVVEVVEVGIEGAVVREDVALEFEMLLPDGETARTPPSPFIKSEPQKESWNISARRLTTIALCGTIDGMIVFAAFIIGSPITLLQLLIGTMLASSFVVFASWQLSSYPPFARFIASLPPWVVITAVALMVLLRGLLRDLPSEFVPVEAP